MLGEPAHRALICARVEIAAGDDAVESRPRIEDDGGHAGAGELAGETVGVGYDDQLVTEVCHEADLYG